MPHFVNAAHGALLIPALLVNGESKGRLGDVTPLHAFVEVLSVLLCAELHTILQAALILTQLQRAVFGTSQDEVGVMVDEGAHIVGHYIVKRARLNYFAEVPEVCLRIENSRVAFQNHFLALSFPHLDGAHGPLFGVFILLFLRHC